jgi:hypothetical protein
MAGTRSLEPAIISQDPEAFDADRPVSALQTLVLRSNTQHLVDMACQYRVHWCASTGAELFTAVTEPTEFVWAFPITNASRNTYPSFDIRIATRFTGAITDGTARASIIELGSNNIITTAFWDVNLTAATWWSESKDVAYPWEGKATRITYADPSITGASSTAATGPGYIMGMLKVLIAPGSGVGTMRLEGVQVREYLSQ